MVTATTEPVRLPPGPRIPKPIQGMMFLAKTHDIYADLARRYDSSVISVNMPGMGHAVVINDAVLAKEVLNASTDLLERAPSGGASLGDAFGSGSTFSLAGDKLLARRKMVLPMFHGTRMRNYEHIIEDLVMREIATWPEGREFKTLPSMTSITLGAILRAVFGAEGPAHDELRDLVPPMATLGGLFLTMPPSLRRDLGPWSPGGRYRRYRRRFDVVIDSLIADARANPALALRGDVLALLVQARYDNGEPIPDQHIADEMWTLLASGHETTAASLAWAVERLTRHPQLLSRLTDEVDAGGSELRQATIAEVQRTRPVLDATMRTTKTRIRLRDWVIPENTNLVVSIRLVHESDDSFPDAASFNPDRFVGVPKPVAWIPFGGGVNRCIGAAFANMESDVTLRMLLREFRFAPNDAPDERRHWRGVATAPARGARAVVYRRTAKASRAADSASLTDHGSHSASGIVAAVSSTPRQYIKFIDPLPWLKIAMNKYWYPFVTRRWDKQDVVFLNWGYEEDPAMGLPLAPEDEPNRYGIQLYHRTATQADLNDKDVLEVSCGHGGGAAYLMKALHPASYTGLDYNPDGVAFARKRHSLPELNFVHGNAESLSFPDESFDAVINIEASHTYPHFDRFLPEVARVLRPGGHFLYADFRGFLEYNAWDAALASMPMRMVSKRDISAEVLRGLDGNSTRYLDLIARHLPKYLQPFGRVFAGAPGTLAYRQLQSGKASYRMYCFVKD